MTLFEDILCQGDLNAISHGICEIDGLLCGTYKRRVREKQVHRSLTQNHRLNLHHVLQNL